MSIIMNVSHDNHDNLIDCQNDEIAVRNRILAQIKEQEEFANEDPMNPDTWGLII